MYPHTPVLLSEVLASLAIQPNSFIVDGTFGRGGHARAILSQLGPQGRLLVIDKDPEAIAVAAALAATDPRVQYWQGSFAQMDLAIQQSAIDRAPDGILLDLGVSSPQLADPVRGFSFLHDGPLDMRMDPTQGISAAEWLNTAEPETIAQVLWQYGEEPASRRIAAAIVAARPIVTTTDLAQLVAGVIRGKPGRHPATQTFQAIRIWINQELTDLEKVLTLAVSLLAPKGRLCIISFHSLEDRRVKQFFMDEATGRKIPKAIPLRDWEIPRAIDIIHRVIKPSEAEIEENPRSRSARLRVVERR